jgi:hypothetical protein
VPAKKDRPASRNPKPVSFGYTLEFKAIDFRKHPELYRIGKGEQGVLLVEPFKGEILPHWKFKTVAEAKKSSANIYKMFLAYMKADDFPGEALRQPQRRSQIRQEDRQGVAKDGRQGEGGSGGSLLQAIRHRPATRRVRSTEAATSGDVREAVIGSSHHEVQQFVAAD